MAELATIAPHLVRLEDGCRALAEARACGDIAAVKVIRDKAETVAQYVRRRDLGLQAMQDAAEIKLRAERALGEMLRETVNHRGGRNARLSNGVLPKDVSKMDSHRWQRIARVPAEVFDKYIAESRQGQQELTTAAVLRLAPKQQKERAALLTCTVNSLDCLVEQGAAFGTIYADPPWRYGNQATRAATDNHYPTMTVEEIAALPIGKLTAAQAHLHLWTTNAFLEDSFRIIRAWGFEYKSVFCWVKPQMGIGNYWRVSHEFLMLGVRGSLPFDDKTLMSWAQLKRGKHSQKPDEIRQMVERASPPQRLELFARQETEGWTTWGNEVQSTIYSEAAKGD